MLREYFPNQVGREDHSGGEQQSRTCLLYLWLAGGPVRPEPKCWGGSQETKLELSGHKRLNNSPSKMSVSSSLEPAVYTHTHTHTHVHIHTDTHTFYFTVALWTAPSNSVSCGPSGPWDTHPAPTGTIHPHCPGPSYWYLFSEHDAFKVSHSGWKKYLTTVPIYITSGCWEYPAEPPSPLLSSAT